MLRWPSKPRWAWLQAWRRHEYATISASTVSMHLAETALSEGTRQRLLARNRALLRDGYARLRRWMEGCEDGLLSNTPPEVLPYQSFRPAVTSDAAYLEGIQMHKLL